MDVVVVVVVVVVVRRRWCAVTDEAQVQQSRQEVEKVKAVLARRRRGCGPSEAQDSWSATISCAAAVTVTAAAQL